LFIYKPSKLFIMKYSREKIRNIAIIAHIDHGKTTLVDSLLKQSQLFRDNQTLDIRMMDSFDQEKERGITIFSKQTAVPYKDYKINIIDTPGHADFSGEVERVLGMVSSVLLLVDAKEGPMPQTRFVLSKALKLGLCPLVVVNKIDRPHARPDYALDATFDLFCELGATDKQLDFPICYASGLAGFAMKNLEDPRDSITPLFDMVIEHVEPPEGQEDAPFLFQSVLLSYDEHLGRQACGRILQGSVSKGMTLSHFDTEGKEKRITVTKIEGYRGLEKIELHEAYTGDIATISGVREITVGDALCDPLLKEFDLPAIDIGEPVLSIDIGVNSSPLVGKSGKHVTMHKIRERLEKEKKMNISLHIDFDGKNQDVITVSGRGELHLSVLIESMRREGFELSIGKPKVILKEEDGKTLEPMERVIVDVPEPFSGKVIEELSRRKGEMQRLDLSEHGTAELEFIIPSRGLMGYRNSFLTMTKGQGILTSVFDHYAPWKGEIIGRHQGVLVANSPGKATGYASFQLQERGILFVSPGDLVYEGMVVGEHARDNDLSVNITREKQLTNVRSAGSDENIVLTPPRVFSLEQAIDYIQADELIEVTPSAIRMRKIPKKPRFS